MFPTNESSGLEGSSIPALFSISFIAGNSHRHRRGMSKTQR